MSSQKITVNDLNGMRRWYRDACGTALAMDLVGERWTLLIVRELLLGPRRFGEIRGALVGLSANILTQRLDGMEKAGILRRRMLPSPANAQVYALTRWGQALEEPIFALSRWAAGSPAHDVTMPLSNAALMLSLRTMMDAAAARRHEGLALAFTVGGDSFSARITDGRLEIARGEAVDAALAFAGAPLALASTFYGPDPLAESQRLGKVVVTGDPASAQAFVDLFRLPRFDND